MGPPGPCDSDSTRPTDDIKLGRYDSFVVRIFSPKRISDVIQGQVTHVATRDTLRFTNPERILVFIRAHVGRVAHPGRADEQELS